MIENRKAYRIPFRRKVMFSIDGDVLAGNALNISSGGVFVLSLDSEKLKRDFKSHAVFVLDEDEAPFSVDVVVRRVVYRSYNPDNVPGVGFEFVSATDDQTNRIYEYMDRVRKKYELAATLVKSGEPDRLSLEPLLSSMFIPSYSDMGELRFQIERVLRSIELVEKPELPLRQ